MDTQVVLITLVLYKALLIGIGLWAQRRVTSEQDFFLGGRQLGPVVAAVSYSASAASAWTLLGMSGLAYAMGVSSLWVALGAIIGCGVSWFVVAPRIMRESSAGDFLSATELIASGSNGAQRRANRVRKIQMSDSEVMPRRVEPAVQEKPAAMRKARPAIELPSFMKPPAERNDSRDWIDNNLFANI